MVTSVRFGAASLSTPREAGHRHVVSFDQEGVAGAFVCRFGRGSSTLSKARLMMDCPMSIEDGWPGGSIRRGRVDSNSAYAALRREVRSS